MRLICAFHIVGNILYDTSHKVSYSCRTNIIFNKNNLTIGYYRLFED